MITSSQLSHALSCVVLIAMMAGGGAYAAQQQPTVFSASAVAQVQAETAGVDAKAQRNRIERIVQKARERIRSMDPKEIRELARESDNRIRLRPDDKDDRCKDLDKKDKQDCKKDKREAGAEQAVWCEVGPDNPHVSSSSGGTRVNVHLGVECPVQIELAVVVGGL